MSGYNKQGNYLMGLANQKLKISTLPGLAKRTGIPYQRLQSKIGKQGYFGNIRADDLRALFRILRMTGEEQAKLWEID